jgi:hypothetical protein
LPEESSVLLSPVAWLTAATLALSPTPTTVAPDPITITVDSAHPAGRLPADFVGLSFEMRELGIGNLDPAKGNTAALLRTLGPSNLRIAGNTLDRDTLWVPEGQQAPDPLPEWVQDIVRPSDIRRLDALLRATGWRTEVGINVGRWDGALGADQAAAMTRILGRRLVAVECGNEPDQWAGKALRPAGYAYPDYHADWLACADAVGHNRIAGPDTAGTSSDWAASLARDSHDRMVMLTVHQYSSGPDATIAKLLSPQTVTNQLNSVAKNLAAANAVGLPMRIDEANSAYSGGVDGVSNKYAAALWGLDYSMQMAQAGLAGVNIHGGLGVCNEPIWNGKWQRYTPICAADKADEAAQIYRAMPIYYGLWMARQMGAGRFLPVTVTGARNLTAYAVRGDDCKLRIAIVQKDETSAAPVSVTVDVGGRDRRAQVLRMTGESLGAEPTAVQGATVDRAGRLAPGRPDAARVRGGSLSLDVAAGSAAVVTLDR